MSNKLPFEHREQKVITKMSYVSKNDLGKVPEDRSIEEKLALSFLNINKPKGPTSHMVAEYVKDLVGASKAGHGGTLDPAVTGVLAVALNDATKVIQTLLHGGKEYVCYMHVHDSAIAASKIRKTMNEFIGDIVQLPPKKSAVKRVLRTRSVYYLDILEINGPDVLFKVGTQAGTYIRKLCTDIGEKLGCGAHMQQLVRTKSTTFSFANAVSLQDVADAMEYYKQGDATFLEKLLVPAEHAVRHIPKVWLTDEAIATVTKGAPLAIPGIVKLEDDVVSGDLCCFFSMKGELVALAKAEMSADDIEKNKKGIAAKPTRIVIDADVYSSAKIVKSE